MNDEHARDKSSGLEVHRCVPMERIDATPNEETVRKQDPGTLTIYERDEEFYDEGRKEVMGKKRGLEQANPAKRQAFQAGSDGGRFEENRLTITLRGMKKYGE